MPSPSRRVYNTGLAQFYDPRHPHFISQNNIAIEACRDIINKPSNQELLGKNPSIRKSDIKLFFLLLNAGMHYSFNEANLSEDVDIYSLVSYNRESAITALEDRFGHSKEFRNPTNAFKKAYPDEHHSFSAVTRLNETSALLLISYPKIVGMLLKKEDGSAIPMQKEIEERYGTNNLYEQIFCLGVEEGRHICQLLDPEIKNIVATIAQEKGLNPLAEHDKPMRERDYSNDPAEADVDDFIAKHKHSIKTRVKKITENFQQRSP